MVWKDTDLRKRLPSHLQERLRSAKQGDVHQRPVVYWMRSALRGHENPALDVAVAVARALRVPVLVVVHVEDHYPQATARRSMFLLQGAQTVQRELHERGMCCAVYVDRRNTRPNVHFSLLTRAALVVAEEPFCIPWLAGVEDLCAMSSETPIWLVDASSVVPSNLVPIRACHRAYTYEQATRALHADRIKSHWVDEEYESQEVPASLLEGLPEPLDLGTADITAVLQEMDVDFSVPSVNHTSGGSQPGYARWSAWLAAGGLRTYAKRRNDSFDVDGVSRMSAYLNTGMVSPMRIAREAHAATGSGKSKFLQEFLVWRGLAYAYCYHFPMPATRVTLGQLPDWARETLQKHGSERRRSVSIEQLAAGQSGNTAWDGMQRYLVQSGELHNNARMGWGKAVAMWASSPEEAIDWLLELNNRFALDGHAPPSYGGLLGCLGLFEGPKFEQRIMGKVSYKPPKAKYATLCEQIKKLTCSPQSGSGVIIGKRIGQLRSTPTSKSGNSPSCKRRWTVALRPQSACTIDL